MNAELETIAAFPEAQAGEYTDEWWFKLFVGLVEMQFPGAGEWIIKAAELIPAAKLYNAVLEAIKDWKEGKDFFTILKEALADWIAIEVKPDGPVMMLKA